MPRPKWNTDGNGIRLMGRPRTVPNQSWRKQEWLTDDLHPDGVLTDVTPSPGCTYVKATWPPRGRGRGESLYSNRRMAAKLRAVRVLQLHIEGLTFKQIARELGFRDGSGAYRAMRRAMDRLDWDERRKQELKKWA